LDELCYTVNVSKVSTVTITIATPGVVSWTSHGLFGGQKIQLTTTGALPTGLSTSTTYWVIPIDANSFKLATSLANAQAGTAIATSGTQSGTHTATALTITISALQDAR
jgi:cytolysin (calcineurin-like family phosphatase)